ncbi:MAG: aldolase/citrate lyase family protein [Bacteroidota bacterium]
MKDLKRRLKQGETLNGCWLNLGSSLTAEMVGLAGFDWVLIDLEHGAGSEKDALHQLQAIQATSAAPMVRVESHARQRLHRILDMGAEGVMCPRISNLEEAKEAVSGWRYPPEGGRGVAKMVRATGFGQHFDEYRAGAEDNIVGIVQIETEEVLNHLDAIAALDGVDVLFIGPADLSMALGIFEQFDHPRFKDTIKATVDAANKAGKATGILLFNSDDYPVYHQMGIRMIASGSDATFVAKGARSMAAALDKWRSQSDST